MTKVAVFSLLNNKNVGNYTLLFYLQKNIIKGNYLQFAY